MQRAAKANSCRKTARTGAGDAGDARTYRDVFDKSAVGEHAVLAEEAEVDGARGVALHEVEDRVGVLVQRGSEDNNLELHKTRSRP